MKDQRGLFRGLFLRETIAPSDFAGRRVTVMGLGLFGGGRGLTEALCRWGADVTVTDMASESKLAKSLEALRGLPLRLVLGTHEERDFREADLVFANPAVPRTAPLLELCRSRGVPIETEMNLFFKLCRGRICAVTGSNGKTTTTSLLAAMARTERPTTRLGGNLGRSLLDEVETIAPDDWTILELSSFQLEDLASIERRPDIALVTNLSPNHLDRHGTYERYTAAKRVAIEGARGHAVLCGDDTLVRSWGGLTARTRTYYGRANRVLPRAAGVWVVADDRVVAVGLENCRHEIELFSAADLPLRGRFNLVNAAGAAAGALALGTTPDGVRAGVRSFRAIPHRLELVHAGEGIEWFNDSIATTPESAICALEALGPRVILIAGGSEKGSSFRHLGRVIALRSRAAILIGLTAPKIRDAIRAADREYPVTVEDSLASAVARAKQIADPGDRIVLSPACASFDMFVNFEDRGRQFTALARQER